MKNKITYIILVILLLIVYIWTNNLYTLWLLVFMVGITIPVVLINLRAAKKVNIEFDILNELKDNPALQLNIQNSSVFPISRINIVFNCENVVFSMDYQMNIDCSIGRKRKNVYQFPIESRYCGQININIDRIYIYDYFGLTKKLVKNHKGCKFYQYPKEEEINLYDIEGSLVSDSALEYKHVKGNDVSEILQIKEYAKGDSVKSIHWKMSAKMGKLMVKELDTPNDNSVMVFFDYAPGENKAANQKMIETLVSLSSEYIKTAVGHTVYRMNTKESRVVHRTVFELSEYDTMLQEILETEAVCNDYRVIDYVLERNIISKYAKVIYITYNENKAAAAELERLDKCLVVYV